MAAVDDDRRPGDVGAGVGCEEQQRAVEIAGSLRPTAKSIKKLRNRFKMSMREFGRLMDVSVNSVAVTVWVSVLMPVYRSITVRRRSAGSSPLY